MGTLQRYVSDELTHFVGRGRPEREQFDLLVEILRTGSLTPPPHEPEAGGHVTIDLGAPVSQNRAYDPEAVCFCDIPVGDLDLHIRKYSPFGLAFRKPFVVERGASPVFYVASASTTAVPDGNGVRDVDRAAYFDLMVREYQRLRDESQDRLQGLGADAKEERDFHERLLRLSHFLDFEVWSFLKFFQYPSADADPENYYMEREWRMLGTLRFGLADVRRVILPEAYARAFRDAFPDYHGQVTFGSPGQRG